MTYTTAVQRFTYLHDHKKQFLKYVLQILMLFILVQHWLNQKMYTGWWVAVWGNVCAPLWQCFLLCARRRGADGGLWWPSQNTGCQWWVMMIPRTWGTNDGLGWPLSNDNTSLFPTGGFWRKFFLESYGSSYQFSFRQQKWVCSGTSLTFINTNPTHAMKMYTKTLMFLQENEQLNFLEFHWAGQKVFCFWP